MATAVLVGLLMVAVGLPLPPNLGIDSAGAATGVTDRVSVDSVGNQANSSSSVPSISGDGRFVAFNSAGSNLVAGDTNNVRDVFVHDRVTGVTERVSVTSAGNQDNNSNNSSSDPSISGDGRFVAFDSYGSNLVAGDTNATYDVFVHDRVTGVTERVSVDSAGNQANNWSRAPSISGDGQFVAFYSAASNLVAGDTNGSGIYDVFVHDRVTGVTERVSVDSAGNQANNQSYNPSISGDGRFVAFDSSASNLVAGDTNGSGTYDVFVHDRAAGVTERVSVDSAGNQADGGSSRRPSISGDGQYVAFQSSASNLVAGDTNDSGTYDVFVHDRAAGVTERVSVDSAGNQANNSSSEPSITGDGRFIAFDSYGSNLVAGDTNATYDVFVHDRVTGVTERVSVDSAGNQANNLSLAPSISGDGQFLAFDSDGSNLIAGDTNNARDVFVHDLGKPSVHLAEQAEPAGGPVAAVEALGGCAPCSYGSRAHATDYPVDTLSGSLWHTFDDLAIPGRGPALRLSRTYNSSQAVDDGPFGHGWSSTYDMSLAVDGTTATVHQESGAQVSFTFDGSSWSAPPRMFASLTENGDGTWTFVRLSREIFTFDASGRLASIADLNGYTTTVTYPDTETQVVTDPAGRTFTFTLSAGRVSSVTDSSTPPRTIAYSYDGAGDLIEVVDEGGGHWQFTYDTSHQMLTMRSPRFYGDTTTAPSPVVTNHYDAQGRVDWQSDPLGRTTSFDYATVPGSTLVTDPKGNSTAYEYEYGLLVSVTRGYGVQPARWQYRYDPDTLGRTVTVDPNDNVSTATYDTAGNLLTATDALGQTTEYTYNSLRQVTSITEPQTINGQPVVASMTYDTAGNPLTESAPLLDAAGVTVDTATTTYHYDDPAHPGDVTGVTDPNGNTTSHTYDAVGNLESVTAAPTSENPAGNTTTFGYNDRGWLTSTTSPRGNVTGAIPADFTTTYGYDDYGRTTLVTDPLGGQTASTYDADGNIDTVTDDNNRTTTYVHNPAGELIETIRPDTSVLRADYWPDGKIHHQYDAANQPTTYTYDLFGNPASTTDPLDRTTETTYDPVGNLLTVVDPSSRTTTHTYNAANQLTSIDYSDPGTPDVTTITYDDNGRRTSMTDGTGTSTWTWDSLGRLTAHTDGNGQTVAYGYDIGGRQTTITYPGTTGTVTRSYDDDDRLIAIEDWNNNVTTFSHDPDSNLTGRSYPNGTATTATVDNASRVLDLTHAPTTTPASPFASFNYTRDGTGSVTSVISTGVPADDHTWGYTALEQLETIDGDPAYAYDMADNLTTRLDGTSQRFDVANQLQSAGPAIELVGSTAAGNASGKTLAVGIPAGTTTDDQLLLAVTLANNKSVTTPSGYTLVGTYTSGNGGQAAKLVLFRRTAGPSEGTVNLDFSHSTAKSATLTSYRGVNPATPIAATTTGAASGSSVTTPSLNAISGEQLVIFTGAHGTAGTWSPPAGMTTTHQQTGGATDNAVFDQAVTQSGQTGTRAAQHSTATELVAAAVTLSPAGTAYGYDPQGNRTSVTDPTGTPVTLSYDQANRLASFNGTTSYGYSGDGLRSSKTTSSGHSDFVWDVSGDLPVLLVEEGTSYIYGVGGAPLAQVDNSGEARYYHEDQLGSTRALTDSTGNVIATYTYDPYGNLDGSTGTVPNPFLFAGEYTDAESGYQYLRARYYDPESGQFLTRDPLVALTREPYGYASGNPINAADPFGLATQPNGAEGGTYVAPVSHIDCGDGFRFFAGGKGKSGRQPDRLSAAEQEAIELRQRGLDYDRAAAKRADKKRVRNEKVVDRKRNKQKRQSNFQDLGAFGGIVGGVAIFGSIAGRIIGGSGPATAGIPFPIYLPPIVYSQDSREQYPMA